MRQFARRLAGFAPPPRFAHQTQQARFVSASVVVAVGAACLKQQQPLAAESQDVGVTGEGYAVSFPIDLVLVRHGQSEANIMIEMKQRGDMSGQAKMDKEGRHDSNMRLTNLGRAQANRVGRWIDQNIGSFDRFYVSEYVRTKETAAELNLKHALWQCDMNIRERDQGVQDGQGDVKMGLSQEEKQRAGKSPMYWAPIGGESMSEVCIRVRLFIQRLQASSAGMKTVVVCHFRVIHAFRLLIEDPVQSEFEGLLSQHMPNGCIWWYSRRDSGGRIHQHIVTCRRIEVKEDGSADIVEFPVRPTPKTNAQLLEDVHKMHQVLNNP